MRPAQTWPAPLLTAAQADALSVLAQHGADFTVEFPARDDTPACRWQLSLHSLSPAGPQPQIEGLIEPVELHWSGARLRIFWGAGLLSAWCGSRYPELAFPALSGPLQAAALESMLAELSAALARSTPWPAPVVVHTESAMACPHRLTLRAACELTGEAGMALLETDSQGLGLLASALRHMPARQDDSLMFDGMPVSLRGLLGYCSVSLNELQSLSAGDVLLLDEYLVNGDSELWLTTGQGRGLRVSAVDSGYRVTQGWTSLMHYEADGEDMGSPASELQDAAGQPLALDEIPVRLSFDLGDRRLTLAQLRELRPGVVFDLQRPFEDGAVMIRANGALIGAGELVEIDGRVGVRLAGALRG